MLCSEPQYDSWSHKVILKPEPLMLHLGNRYNALRSYKSVRRGERRSVLLLLLLIISTIWKWGLVNRLNRQESRRQHENITQIENESSGEVDEESSRQYEENHKENRSLAPPEGYPWHRWSQNSITSSAVVETWESVQKCNLDENRDLDECRFYSHLAPYILRSGDVYSSRSVVDYVLSQAPNMVRRQENFIESLQLALEIAKKNRHLDERIERLVNSSFPVFLHKDDLNGCRGPLKPFLAWSIRHDLHHCDNSFPVPSYYLWRRSKERPEEWTKLFQKWNETYPWDEKIPTAVWRGGTTGHSKTTWQDLPRTKMVNLAKEHLDVIDAAFVTASGRWKGLEHEIETDSRLADRISQDDFMRHIAVIDIDGNGWSSRFGNLLCYNSVVVKVQPRDVDYFYDELVPWKHYLPVHANLSNFVEVVEYAVAEEHRAEMKQIVENANNWCAHKLTRTQLATDLMWTLATWLELLNKDEDFQETWNEHKTAYRKGSLRMSRATS